jgi:RNA polymerase sigma-70 factor (ECF subfamily)
MEKEAASRRRDLTPSLVIKLRAGDTTAGNLLDQLYRRALLRFCWRYLDDRQEAEDAVQEVFQAVLRATDVPNNFRAWLYKIAHNRCLDLRRARGRRHEKHGPVPGDQLPEELTGPLTGLVNQEQRSRILHLVAALPEAQREILRLRYTENLKRAEIAYVLDIPEKLVKSRLCAAMRKLGEHTSLIDKR